MTRLKPILAMSTNLDPKSRSVRFILKTILFQMFWSRSDPTRISFPDFSIRKTAKVKRQNKSTGKKTFLKLLFLEI
jgi:hypothetical protein